MKNKIVLLFSFVLFACNKSDLIKNTATQPSEDLPQLYSDEDTKCNHNVENFPYCQAGALTYSTDGKFLAAICNNDYSVKVWDTTSYREIADFKNGSPSENAIAFSPDSKLLAVGKVDTIKLWNIASKAEIATIQNKTEVLHSLAFSPDGKYLAWAGFDGADDPGNIKHHPIRIYDLSNKSIVASLPQDLYPVFDLAFSPDGSLIAAANYDGIVRLWETRHWEKTKELIAHKEFIANKTQSVSLAFSPDGKQLLVGYTDFNVRLWEVNSGRLLRNFQPSGSSVNAVAFSPDGKIIATGSSSEMPNYQSVKLWDVATGNNIATLKGNVYTYLIGLAFSPDGNHLATGGDQGRARIYSIKTGKSITPMSPKELETHRILQKGSAEEIFDLIIEAEKNKDENLADFCYACLTNRFPNFPISFDPLNGSKRLSNNK